MIQQNNIFVLVKFVLICGFMLLYLLILLIPIKIFVR